MASLFLHSFATEFGPIRIASENEKLILIWLPGGHEKDFNDRARKLYPLHNVKTGGAVNDEAQRQLAAYFEGRLKKFDLPLNITGSPFQKFVLKRIGLIAYGRTMTYGEVAASVGHDDAARAVGTTMARNPLPLVLPCHRVLAAHGLGGYGGGLKLKTNLLRLEGAI